MTREDLISIGVKRVITPDGERQQTVYQVPNKCELYINFEGGLIQIYHKADYFSIEGDERHEKMEL